MRREPRAAAEGRELDQKRAADDLTTELTDELAQCPCGAARGQQIVVDEHARAVGHRVGMDLERVEAVLERVLGRDGVGRKLARLAGRDESGAELAGERRAEDEAPRLRGDDVVDRAVAERIGEPAGRLRRARGDRAAAA